MRITGTMATGGRWSVLLMIALLIFFTVPLPAASVASQEEKKGVSIGKATGIGALLGLGLGQSLGGIISGAAIGAAGGMIANEVIRQKDNQKAPPAQPTSTPAEPEPPKEVAQEDFDAEIEKAIGRDNYEGYKALRACEFKRASGLAKVGALSKNDEYRLVSLWLEAMISIEARDGQSQELFEQLVQKDPDIDTAQQASIETDKAVLDRRNERREMGLPSCRG